MKKLLLFLGYTLLLSGCMKDTREPTVEAPLKYCTRQYTWASHEEAMTTYNCYNYNKDGNCEVNIPTTTYYTHREIEYHCAFRQYN